MYKYMYIKYICIVIFNGYKILWFGNGVEEFFAIQIIEDLVNFQIYEVLFTRRDI